MTGHRIVGGFSLVCAIASCSTVPHNGTPVSSSERPEIPAALFEPTTLYDIRAEVAPLDEGEVLAAPLGIPVLRTSNLRPGVREIRIYSGLVIGYPHMGLIVRDENGRVTGRLFRYWPRNDTAFTDTTDVEKLFEATEAGRCSAPVKGTHATACTVQFVHEPDWNAFLAALDSVNAWALPDESRVPRRGMMLDGWELKVEARRDTGYVRYQYHNPQIYRPPEGREALHIMLMVDSLFRYTRPPSSLRYVRGIFLFGHDTLDFSPCGQPDQTGWFVGRLGPFSAAMGDSVWKAHSAPTRVFRVEAWVRLDEHAHSYYKRSLPRTWNVDSVTAILPVSRRDCPSR